MGLQYQPNQPNNAYGIRGEPAVHKYPRNTLHRLQHVAGAADGAPGDSTSTGGQTTAARLHGTPETGSVHDNGFISHMIPRTDSQYTWITGSLIS
jgi:hypothetical protein